MSDFAPGVKVATRMPTPPADKHIDSGDEKQVRQQKLKQQTRTSREDLDMRTILATAEGRRVLYRLIGFGKPFNDCFATNALTMANLAGMAKVSNMIISAIGSADPRAFAEMQLEDLLSKEA